MKRRMIHRLGLTAVLIGGLSLTGCPDAQKKAADAMRAAADELEELDLDAIAAEVEAEVAQTINKENALSVLQSIAKNLEEDIQREAAEAG